MEDLVNLTNIASHYYNKKVFVTGHTGFKGSWFIAWLQLAGAKIKGYALAQDEQSLFNIVSSHINIESIIADIRDKEKLQEELLKFQPDYIFHFAAQPLVRRSYELPAETFDINVTGTANLLEAIKALPGKCSVVIVTTDKVYENKETDYHYKESDVLGGYDPYSASKACAEMVVSSFRNSFFHIDKYNEHQKAIATARAGNVIGGGDWNKDRIVPDIVRSLSADETIAVRNPNAVRPWQHVLEPLGGYLLLGTLLYQQPQKFSGPYNFGPAEEDHLPVKKLVEIAIDCWRKGKWNDTSDATQPHEAGLLKLDINKAKKDLRWNPKLNSTEAIQWTIDWYKQSDVNKYDFTLQQIKKYQQG